MIIALILACGLPSAPSDAPVSHHAGVAPATPIWLPPAPVEPALDIVRADEVALETWTIDEPWTSAVAAVGDVDGDGVADLALSADNADDDSLASVWMWSTDAAGGSIPAFAGVGTIDEYFELASVPSDDDGDGRSEVWFETWNDATARRVIWDGAGWQVLSTWAGKYSGGFTGGIDVTGDGWSDAARNGSIAYGPLPTSIDEDLLPEIGTNATVSVAGDYDGDGIGDAFVVTNQGLGVADLVGAPSDPAVPDAWLTDAGAAIDAGDVDGDGYRDVVVSDVWYFATWSLVPGPPGVGALTADVAVATGSAGFLTEPVATGDLDGDGADDLAIRQYDPWYGIVKVAYGPVAGTVDGSGLPGWRGPTPYDWFGNSIAPTEIDGARALAIDAPQWGHGGDGTAGGVFLLAPP